MPLNNTSSTKNGITKIYVFDEETPKSRALAYEIDEKKEIVTFHPRDARFPLKTIVFEGFKKIPLVLHENGYFKGSIGYSLGKKLSEGKVQNLTVPKNGNAKFKKQGKANTMVLPYSELLSLIARFKAINAEARSERQIASAEIFSATFPQKYNALKASDSTRFSRLVANLDSAMIKTMSPEQVEALLNFAARVISEKYTSVQHREKLFGAAKLKFDAIALDEVISTFEDMLKGKHSEADWGKFLKTNLFLVESRYVDIIPELNLMLGGMRKVDFGLVDTHEFLDLFEIKKPDTQLLAKTKDRGNWYWSTAATQAIAQAEKYLYNAERKGAQLAEDIKREYGISVQISKPRAVLIMGSSNQLKEDSQIIDFRVLCAALKNVEVVTYDDLLLRLINQKNKNFVTT